MQLDKIIFVKGCITQERYIMGKSLAEIEQVLGFQKGRLEKGIAVAVLLELPATQQFDLLGYTQVAEHKFNNNATKGLDLNKLKEMVRKETFTLTGNKRLVKVMANIPHNEYLDSDIQYPPGKGVPQWKLTSRMRAKVVNIISPGGYYKG